MSEKSDKTPVQPSLMAVIGAVASAAGVLVVAMAIHVPVLVALGVRDWPGTELTLRAATSAVAFLLASVLVAAGSWTTWYQKQRWQCLRWTVGIAGALLGAGAFALAIASAESEWSVSGVIAWFVGCAAIGILMRALAATIHRADGTPTNWPKALILLVTCVVLFLGTASAYSLALLRVLPDWLGGVRVRPVYFKVDKEAQTPLRLKNDTDTQAVWLLYSDEDHHWVKYRSSSDRSKMLVVRLSRSLVNDPIESHSLPEPPLDRPREWKMKFDEVRVKGGGDDT